MESDARVSTSDARADEQVTVIETAEVASVGYEWGAIKWICDLTVTPTSLQSFGYAYVLPGKTNPEHWHKTCEEIIYMLSGGTSSLEVSASRSSPVRPR